MKNGSDLDLDQYVPDYFIAVITDSSGRQRDNLVYDIIILSLYGSLTVFGLLGNTLAFILMLSKSLSKHSYSVYCATLAVFDSCSLLVRTVMCMGIIHRLIYGKDYGPLFTLKSDWSCRLVEYFCDNLVSNASFLVVLISLERLIIVRFPFASRRLCTRKSAIKIILSMIIFLAAYLSIVDLQFTYYVEGLGCVFFKSQDLMIWLHGGSTCWFAPVFLVIIINSIILATLSKRKTCLLYTSPSPRD